MWTNPAEHASPPVAEHREIVSPPRAAVARLLAANDDVFGLHAYFRLSVSTGARRGQMCRRKTPWRPNCVTKTFIGLRDEVGLRGFRLHDLRHFMATEMLAAGVPIPVVSARLAHARASTTLNVYAHAIPGGDRQAANLGRSPPPDDRLTMTLGDVSSRLRTSPIGPSGTLAR